MHRLGELLDSMSSEISSVSINIQVDSTEVFHQTIGLARQDPARHALDDQAYDLASLTKVLATTTIIACLVHDGVLRIEDKINQWIPQVDERMTVAHLLSHTAGFPAWRPLYLEAKGMWGTQEAVKPLVQSAVSTALIAAPGEQHCYSDLGFITLLDVLQKVTQMSFSALFERHVRQRFGVTDMRWGWPTAAATEDCPFRKQIIEGTVHDLNCASLGGVSSHAGLFATARAVSHLANQWLKAWKEPDKHSLLPGEVLRSFWTYPGLGSHRLGFDSITPGASSTGQYFPADAVGHLGYTGNSLWVVPSEQAVITLLTNRVHPVDDSTAIRHWRPIIHDAVAQALGWA